MPLNTFSRILSSKSPAATPKKPAPEAQPPSGSSKPSPLRFYSRRKNNHESPSPSPGKSREPRAFNFSFDRMNLFGSLRGRTKLEKTESRPSSGTIFNDISYSGYEDEEYGEPQAEAEEIRRPSGLGRRASIAEEKIHVSDMACLGHGVERGQTDVRVYDEDASGALETDACSEATHESDGEELAEIRYPSGLGNFKPVISSFDPERPRSTYPIFETERPAIKRGMSMPELSASASGASPPHSAGLSKVIPLLAPYLSRRTLSALTLVDKAAAEAARQCLWKNIALEVTLRPRGPSSSNRADVLAHTSLHLLDTLSARPELAHMVESLELHCCRDARTMPKSSRRPRPPSLTLSFDPRSFLKADSAPSQLTKRYSAPAPRENDVKLSPVLATRAAPSTNGDDERATLASHKARRASSFIPSSISLKANFPEAWKIASAKLPSPSVQPAPPLFKRRSLTFTDSSASQPQVEPKSPFIPNGTVETPPSSPKLLPPGSSNWTPPAEWGWIPREHRRYLSSGPSSGHAPSPPFSPPPNTGGSAPHSWIAPSPTSEHRARPKSSLPSLKTGLHAPSPSMLSPRLKTYPSLPSLRAPYTPTSPGFLASDDILVSPVTTVPSPITPHSPVSLSNFPLPPQTLTPCSTPKSLQFSPSLSRFEKSDVFPSSPLTPTLSANARFLQRLMSVSENMSHLTHVTVLFALAPLSEPSPPIPSTFTRRSRSCGHDGDACDIDAITELRDSLMKLKSLKSLKVVCTAGQEALHRAHWSLPKDKPDGFDVEVMCVT